MEIIEYEVLDCVNHRVEREN